MDTGMLADGGMGNENSTGDIMQRSLDLATSQAGEPSVSHWGFATPVAIALIVIVLLTLTFAALEVFLSGDESLSALEAVMGITEH